MTLFIDTSGFYAVLCRNDSNHDAAKSVWVELLSDREELVCSNYVLLETFALLQNRLGMEAVRAFQEDVVPLLTIEWINEERHNTATTSLLIGGRRQLSLVDCTSFDIMRRLGIETAFVFDEHFKEQGFNIKP